MTTEGVRIPSLRPGDRTIGTFLPLAAAYLALAGVGVAVPLLDRPALLLVPVALAAAVALAARRIDIGICALVAATALNRYNFEVAGWNAKIENVVVLIVLMAWAWRVASGRERAQKLPLALVIGAFLLVNLVSTVLNSADPYKSFRIVVRMGLAVAILYLTSSYVSDASRLRATLRALLIVGAAASAYGLVALIVWHVGGQDIGVQYSSITGAVSAKGTLWEGNIFGSFVAGTAVLSGALLISRKRTFHRGMLFAAFALALAALIVSLTRAAWVGFAAGAVLAVFLLRGASLRVVLLVAALAAVVLITAFRLDLGGVPEDISARLGSLPTIRADINTVSRLKNADLAVAEWRSRPWLGWGTDSFHINHPEILSALPSPQLSVLYDTGLIGLVLFVGFVGALLLRFFKASVRADDETLATLLGALLIATIAQLVAFQATDAFWLGFPWVYFGLMVGAERLVQKGVRVEGRD